LARLVCPYCFECLAANRLAFRCINSHSPGCQEEDALLARYERLSHPNRLPRVFAAPQRVFGPLCSTAVCSCGTTSNRLVCPMCHNDLPSQFGSYDSFMIATIGAKDVGKSHYIAVLIEEMTHRVGGRFNASLSALDERTIRRYRNDFHRYVYTNRELIPETLSAATRASSTRYPLIYRFSLMRRGLLGKQFKATSLVFFDTAGEDLDSCDKMSLETRYIANSNGLLFLLDPLQIPAVRHRLGGRVELPGEYSDPLEIVTRVARLVRDFQGLSPTQPIRIPVALAFTKVDAVRDLFDPGSPVHRAPEPHPHFDLEAAERMSASVRAHLEDWTGSDALHSFITHNFERFHYFAISSLGSSPAADKRLPGGAAPFRVEEPLLWILSLLKVIPSKRGGRQ